MALDPNIILSGLPFDPVGSMARGNQLAMQTNQMQDQNALRQVYRTQGPGIMAGDRGALNALAQIDPQQAMSVQAGQLDMRATQQRMDMLSRDEQRQIAQFKAQASAEEAAAAAAQIEDAVKMGLAIQDPAQWDAMMQQQAPELVGQFANRQAFAMKYMSMAEALKAATPADPTQGAPAGMMWVDPSNRAAGVRPLPGAEKPQAPYTTLGKAKADLAAGRITKADYDLIAAGEAPRGTSLSVDPTTGAITFTQGAVNTTGEPTIGEVYNPGSVSSALTLIDQILANPSLGRITGPVEGGGGNNIDDLSAMQRAWYGTEGLDAIDKTNQLQSKAWLSARQMLKGGGAITDYESKKAEAAVARLSRAKGEAEFRSALTDLRDAITSGEAKLRAAGSGSQETAPAPAGSTPSLQQSVPLSPDLQAILDKYSTP